MTSRREPSTATAAYYDVRLELNSRSSESWNDFILHGRSSLLKAAGLVFRVSGRNSAEARWGALELRLWIQASAIERRCKPAVQANIYAFMFSAGSAMVWNRMLHGGPLSDLKSFRALGSGRVYPQKSIRKAYDM